MKKLMKKLIIVGLLTTLFSIASQAITYPSTSYELRNNMLIKWTGPETEIDLTADPHLRDYVEDIYDKCFAGNTNLKSIVLTATIEDVMGYAFDGCTSLEKVVFSNVGADGWEVSEQRIQFGAFRNCSALKSVTLPQKLTYVYEDAFEGCTSLTSFTLKNHSSWMSSGGIIYTKERDKLILFPPGITGHFDVPQQVTEIADGAFYNTALSTVYLPNVQTIGESAFEEAKNLTAVNFPNTLRTIDRWAFNKCEKLKTLILPNSVETIGNAAFGRCTSLPATIKLPASLSQIAGDAFRYCTPVKRFEVAADNPYYSTNDEGILFDKDKSVLVAWPAGNGKTEYVVDEGITAIGDYAFYGATIQSVILPVSLRTIGELAFARTLLTDVTIPIGVTFIDENAFFGTLLTKVSIPEGVEVMDMAFYHCEHLSEIELPSTLTQLHQQTFDEGPSTPRKIVCHLVSPIGGWNNDVKKDTLYVPEESVPLFQMAPGWRNFGDIRPIKEVHYYPVTFEQPEHGWLVVEGNGDEIESGTTLEEGSTIVVSAIALEYPDYQLDRLTVNGREIENNSSFTLTEPVNIVAEFGSHVATGITKGEYRADNENTVVYDLSGRKVTDKQKSRNGGLREGVYIIRTPDGVRKISR